MRRKRARSSGLSADSSSVDDCSILAKRAASASLAASSSFRRYSPFHLIVRRALLESLELAQHVELQVGRRHVGFEVVITSQSVSA